MKNIKDDDDKILKDREKLLNLLLEEEGFRDLQTHAIVPGEKKERPPLSFAQQRLWFLNQLNPGNPAYNVPIAFCLSGPLNTKVLEQSLHEIVRRHETLRTTFATLDGEPVQIIAPISDVTIRWVMVDLPHLLEEKREVEAWRLITEDARRPFDLVHGPLLRVSLFRISEAEHILLLVMHHIVSDGWSRWILFQEITGLYKAFLANEPSPLSNLSIQYADFAVWQRKWLQGEVLERQLSYWKEQLSGELPVLHLPTDRPAPPVQTFHGTTYTFMIPKTMADRLKMLGQKEGATFFMMLIAVFKVLLYRYTGKTDILIGTPIANRNRTELEGLIGFFVNTLVLRTDLSGDPSFLELLGRVREVALEAYDHQDVPFERLIEMLQPKRNLSRTPLFQVMFALQNTPTVNLDLPGLTIKPVDVEIGTAKFDLSLFFEEREEGLTGRLEYNSDLFDSSTMSRLAGHFQTLLSDIIADPEQCLSKLRLLTETEQHQLLIEWNNTRTEYLRDQCVHQIFEAQTEQSPDTIAVIFEDVQLTYQELNQRANQLARHLRTLGVGPETLVGICLERSIEMVVGLLGVLKAGGAYVPIDPALPNKRLLFMLEDTHLRVLLTQQSLVRWFPEHGVRIVCLDTDWGIIMQQNTKNLLSETTSENLAYLLFTSGSTGKAKGVAIEHRQLLNYLNGILERLDLTAGASFALVSTFAADLGNTAIFPALCTGGSLHVISQERASDPEALTDYFRRHAIDCLKIVPSHLEALLTTSTPEQILPQQLLILGGETSSWKFIEKVHTLAPDCLIFNHYGPTETTIGVTTYQWQNQAAWHQSYSATLPLGRPLANTQIYILDSYLQLVPIGVSGELCVGGSGLARGYLNRPALTAEKFIPNLFSNEIGARLYRTGDLARYLPDGNIEFLGRIDQQVKIWGFRVEPGEIEATLSEYPGVQDVIIMDREDLPGGKQLVGYIVPTNGFVPTSAEMRSFLKERLPDYMIPSVFVKLDAIPLTPNGKVDRRALPAPDTSRPELEETFLAPRTPVEKKLAGIWAAVLGLEKVGVHDSFFELGGHSLQAVQLVSKMSTAMKRKFSVKDIFLYPTIALLASTIKDMNSIKRETPSKEASTTFEEHASFTVPSTQDLPLQQFSPFLKIEHRPLLSLLATGKISPVNAAALGYLPRAKFTHNKFILNWLDNLPFCTNIIEMFLGRIAVIFLPCFDSELYVDEGHLVSLAAEALKMAKHLGARVVSLTGLVPSATDYGRTIALNAGEDQTLPVVSTGHATTTAAVILSIKRILRESGRDLAQERVGILGLGSIGTASLRLMLKCLPHPSAIILCDLYSKIEALRKIKQEIITDLAFQGAVHITESHADLPPEFYEATLIIGATNVPDVLDITDLNPGTMIVDDSSPHCFNAELAIQRVEEQADILFTEGGVLKSPSLLSELRYVPREAAHIKRLAELEAVLLKGWRYNPFNITGCVLSSLLSSCFEDLKPTLGLVSVEACLQHYEMLTQLGFQGADLHCKDYTLSRGIIHDFQNRFGR